MTSINRSNLKYDVLVEQVGKNGYTARVLTWPNCVVEALTREEALRQIRKKILERLAKADIITIEIEPEEVNNPWLKFSGDWADDPDFDEFQAEIERYRHEIDAAWSPWYLESEEETSDEAVTA